jgi:tetratricopeptide (TPR) repeat protein
VGEVPQKFMILLGLWVSFLMRADYPTSWKLARQLLELSQTASAPGAQVVAHQCMSGSAFFTGDLDLAMEHAQTGVAYYRGSGYPHLGPAYGFDPGILCFEWNAWALLMKGYPDEAMAVWSEGSRLAIEQGHPLTIATNKVHSADFENLRDNPEATLVRAADAAAYCAEHGILLRQVESEILEGWAQAKTGDIAGGIRKTESALVIWRQLGARIWDSGWYLYLAQAHLLEGNTQKCRSALTEALDAAHNHGEHPCTAELYRFEAELCLAEGKTTAVAEALLRKAIDRARDQNAKLWELRAATALARLWRAEGKTIDASNLLRPVYDWFTEGFDTKDLKEGKALLAELGR